MDMNRFVAKITIVFVLFVGQLSVCSEFSVSLPEVQLGVFCHSDNKNNMQRTNKEWYAKGSIQSPTIFTADFYRVNESCIKSILLNAAYVKNYKGVENILKNTPILERTDDNLPYYCIDFINEVGLVMDLRGIAKYNKDITLWQLLEKYKVPAFNPKQTICEPNKLMMCCFAGNSDDLKEHPLIDYSNVEIVRALKVSIDFDHVKCIKILLDHSIQHDCKLVFGEELLERACVKKNIKALQVLLAAKIFDVNGIATYVAEDYSILHQTFLDKILYNVQKDPEYNIIVNVLKQFNAKTAVELGYADGQEVEVIDLADLSLRTRKEVVYTVNPYAKMVVCSVTVLLCGYLLKQSLCKK